MPGIVNDEKQAEVTITTDELTAKFEQTQLESSEDLKKPVMNGHAEEDNEEAITVATMNGHSNGHSSGTDDVVVPDKETNGHSVEETVSNSSADDSSEKPTEDQQVEEEKKVETKENETKEEETKEEETKEPKEGEEAPIKQLDIRVQIPGGSEPITVPLTNHDTIQDVRQVVLEQPDCCFRTCFCLQLNGKRLDDFTELHDIAGLTSDSILTVVDEPYSVREVRIHIRRLRDLMITSLEPNAFTATDNLSLSYCQNITGVDVEEEVIEALKDPHRSRGESVLPPDYAMLEKNGSPLLKPLLLEDHETPMPPCLKDMRYSAWNPPPGNRKLAGDLLYLVVRTLESNTYHITASSNGFFVNRSDYEDFNPNPASEPQRAQTLVAILNQLSPAFKKNFTSMQRIYDTCSHYKGPSKTPKKHPLELVASPIQVFPWISPRFEHTVDPFRAEDSVTNRIGYEEQIPGQLRDWNEELQSAKELPKKTLHQRVLRDRALYKITCDFIAAATRGTIAVVDGNVMAINPGDDEKMRMYIWNNIFFSFACDSREHYEKYGGDEAAYTAASLDLKGVEAYNKLDIDGLHTLGTVIVDYRGYRIVAQSIIPGILQREQENSVVYGSVDGGKTISGHEKFFSMLSQAGMQLRLRPHTVVNEKDEEVQLCSSIECKGIIGADGRHYILDLFRTFPPDVNFLNVPKVERFTIEGEPIEPKEEDASKKKFPSAAHGHKLVSLRPVLAEAFNTYKYLTFVNIITRNYRELKAKADQDKKLKDEEDKKETKQLAIKDAGEATTEDKTEEATTEAANTESTNTEDKTEGQTEAATSTEATTTEDKVKEATKEALADPVKFAEQNE